MASVMLLALLPNLTAFAANDQTLFIAPEDFKDNLGSWTYMKDDGSSPFASMLIGRDDKAKNLLQPAGVNISIQADGVYTVYVRTRDYASNQGTRKSQIAVNGSVLPHVLGAHGTDGWAWETVGTVSLKAGVTCVQLVDITGYTPRVEAVVLSTNAEVKSFYRTRAEHSKI